MERTRTQRRRPACTNYKRTAAPYIATQHLTARQYSSVDGASPPTARLSHMNIKGSVTITLDGSNKSTKLPLRSGSLGPDGFDIHKLYGDLGVFTYDPGYGATASCSSKITYIDGDEGILLYRGYPIEQLAEQSNFLEVCYLLLNGELPSAAEAADFELGVMRHTMLHEQLRTFYNGFRRDAHPMAGMGGGGGGLS